MSIAFTRVLTSVQFNRSKHIRNDANATLHDKKNTRIEASEYKYCVYNTVHCLLTRIKYTVIITDFSLIL